LRLRVIPAEGVIHFDFAVAVAVAAAVARHSGESRDPC
jgi:hypothetical protein